MELDQILKLIDAGYTKTDIEAMTSAPANVSTEPTAPTEPAEPVREAAPAAKPEPVEAPAVNPDFSALLEEMKGIRKQLQMQAILHDGFTPASPDDAQQILASIINPATKGKD